jgi:hypothetical protein
MNFDDLGLVDRVALYVLPALLSNPDTRKNLSNKTIIHEARQIAETFVSTAGIQTDNGESVAGGQT